MKPIILQGVQIVDHKRMKQAGLYRWVFELTSEDSIKFAGELARAEANEMIFDITLAPQGIQGEHQDVDSDANRTPYQLLRDKIIIAHGYPAYEKIKKNAGVKHLKDIKDFDQFFMDTCIELGMPITEYEQKLLLQLTPAT